MSLANPQRRSQPPAAVRTMYIGFPPDLVYFGGEETSSLIAPSVLMKIYRAHRRPSSPRGRAARRTPFPLKWVVVLLAALSGALPSALPAQVFVAGRPAQARAPLRVFFDCSGPISCQPDHLRTELPWVSWVTNREDADVHVISTRQDLGGGGINTNIEFQGLGAMSHLADELNFTTPGTDVMRVRIDGFTRALKLGLTRFALERGLGSELDLLFAGSAPAVADSSGVIGAVLPSTLAVDIADPWNYWTFRVGMTGNLSSTQTRSSHRVNLNLGADRITDGWKFTLASSGSVLREEIELSGGRRVKNDRDSWNVSTILVRSMSPHVSTGVDLAGGKEQQNNRQARVEANPAVEWNLYPYSQSSRRQLIVHYGAGFQHNNYEEETVFGVMRETVPFHRVGLQYSAVERWGQASLNADASQYLHESGLYSYGAQGSFSLRIARGLDLTSNANAQRIADQINIRASQLTDEEILLGREALPTSYSYAASTGFNYRWGSGVANIVNARFPQSVR